ncbi:MAG: cyclopropane fatty acyl phospholipid synthase [Candidatus Latescibacterota bacterium]|nr:cyclopropane fatty acyl phospholipid synthase [Candidatus Latescibacterota bacterium]
MKEFFDELLAPVDIRIDGDRPWDIQVHNPDLYPRVIGEWSLGLGEAYMDGWWTAEAVDQFFYKLFRGGVSARLMPFSKKVFLLKSKMFNRQNRQQAREVVDLHYELDVDLFMSFLDPYNQYTCGYFQDTDDLNAAQEQKLDLICRKLRLGPEDRVLDIGCGWGGFAKFAAERYQCHVTGISIADVQIAYAREFCQGLPVEIVKSDYRDHRGSYHKILCCGMIEAVGYKNYRPFFEMVHRNLKDDGLFLLHTISRHDSGTATDPWIDKYIFRNGMLPSAQQLSVAAEDLFALNDWHSFGAYYDPTLMAWNRNFSDNWDRFKEHYDEAFYRMWEYYFLSCAGSFRANEKQLWQVVYGKWPGAVAGYQSVR